MRGVDTADLAEVMLEVGAGVAAKDMREAGAGVMAATVMGEAGVGVMVEAIAGIRDGVIMATGAAMGGAAAIGVEVTGEDTGGGLITDMA